MAYAPYFKTQQLEEDLGTAVCVAWGDGKVIPSVTRARDRRASASWCGAAPRARSSAASPSCRATRRT